MSRGVAGDSAGDFQSTNLRDSARPPHAREVHFDGNGRILHRRLVDPVSESARNQAYFSRTAVAEISSAMRHCIRWNSTSSESYFPLSGARVLDIGCGAGRTTAALAQRGYRVTAIDYSPDMVAATRSRGLDAEILQMDAATLAFADRSFDAALFSFNGLDGIFPSQLRRRALGEMHRVVRPGGVLYFSGHNWLGALGRSGGNGVAAEWRRKMNFVLAQRPRTFAAGYGVYRDDFGEQILYHRTPFCQLRLVSSLGLKVRAVYGSDRFEGPAWRTALPAPGRNSPAPWTLPVSR